MPRSGRIPALLSLAGFGLFLINTVIGKLNVAMGNGVAPPIDGVAEFLVLAFAVICAVVWLVEKENDLKSNQGEEEE